MGNTLTSEQPTSPIKKVLKPLARPLKPLARLIPTKLKKFAKGNLAALAKRGLKLHPRFHLELSIPANHGTIETILKFLNQNRMRIASLKKLSINLGADEILPLLMTTKSIRPMVKKLGQRLSRFRSLESAEIGSSHLNAFCIEETLIENLTKLKKVNSLTLGVPDNQHKINFIARKLVNMKTIETLHLNFYVANASWKPILNSLKCCPRLIDVKLNLQDCTVNAELIMRLAETVKMMKRLERFEVHLERTAVKDQEIKYLIEVLETHRYVKFFKIHLKKCPELSWWIRAQLFAKENFNNRC